MSVASISIQRPVLTWVIAIIIMIFGFLGLRQLGVREYPAIDPAIITITTSYKGANAEVIEQQITEPLESALNGIDGVRTISSQSSEGRSRITIEFLLSKDLEQAANDVRDKVSRVQRMLPADVDPPVVSKADADASPILMMSLQSASRPLEEISEQAKWIQERLQTVPGVAEIYIWGERKRALRIRFDARAMAARNITFSDVKTALALENVDLPAGQIKGALSSISLRANAGISSAEDLAGMIIKRSDQGVVRLSDVAQVLNHVESTDREIRLNGVRMLMIAVAAQPGFNQIEIVDEVTKRVAELSKDFPDDLKLETAFDNTRFVKQALSEVQETFVVAFFLVVLVIFIFLRDWRTTVIPVIAIPVSLIGTFFVIWIMGFSINILTLLAVILAIGLVVDDTIVVLENIYAKVEAGTEVKTAAIQGTQEIFLAVVATTLVLVAVFTPLLFLEGFTGRLFKEFGVVIGASVLISGFVALTLGSMLSSRLLKQRKQHNWFYNRTEPFYKNIDRSYERLLSSFLRHPKWAIPIILVTLALTFVVFTQLKQELAPLEDRSMLSIMIGGPEGATFDYMNERMLQVEALVKELVPEAHFVMANVGAGSANMRISLVAPENRARTQQQLAMILQQAVGKIDGIRANVIQEQTIRMGGRASQPVQVVMQASSMEELRRLIPAVQARLSEERLLVAADVDLRFTKPQMDVQIDREQLRDMGLTPTDVGSALQSAFSSQRYAYWVKDGQQYQIIGELDSLSSMSPDALDWINMRNSSGDLVPLSQVVTLAERQVPPAQYRLNRFAAATFSAGLGPGASLGEAVARMRQIIQEEGGEAVRTELAGSARDLQESSGSLVQVFVLALVLVYLLLAGQFESFRDPFIIMLTVPLALAGALASLWLTNNTINLFSQIGLVMLVGLVTKNGILIVEFSRQRQRAGFSLVNAVAEASAARLRPILMTTLSTVLGILPIALALGAGAESRAPMGIAVVGGLLSSLVLTLLVVPAMIVVLSRKDELA